MIPVVKRFDEMDAFVDIVRVALLEQSQNANLDRRRLSVLGNGPNDLDSDSSVHSRVDSLDDFTKCALAKELDEAVSLANNIVLIYNVMTILVVAGWSGL